MPLERDLRHRHGVWGPSWYVHTFLGFTEFLAWLTAYFLPRD